MPQPSDVHVNTYLGSISVAFLQDATKFVADTVFPRVPVQKKSDKYATFPRGHFLRSNMQKRGPGAKAATATYEVSKDSYDCEVWALSHPIDDQERANQDAPFDADRETVEFLTLQELIKREEEWGSAFFTTSKWTGSSTATDLVAGTDYGAFDDAASDPIYDISYQMQYIESQTGFLPTDLTLTRPGWLALKSNPNVLSRVDRGQTPGQPAQVTRANFAALCELERVNVAAAIRNTGLEGASDSLGYILGKHALLTYRPPNAGLRIPSAGYTFVWNGLVGSAEGRHIRQWREEAAHSDWTEIEAAWDQKIVSAALGAFFASVCT